MAIVHVSELVRRHRYEFRFGSSYSCSNIEWLLNNRVSVETSYDDVNDISSSALGNLGADVRWRLEFE